MVPRAPLLACLVLVGCAAAALASQGAPAPPAADASSDPGAATVRVYYPGGGCETGELHVQLWSREQEAWVDHPEHPHFQAGTCQRERPEVLLDELRVRCVDPEGVRAPSPWVVGAQRLSPLDEARCPGP